MSAQEDGLSHGLVGVEGPSLGIVREVHAEVGPQGLGRGVLELLGQHPQPAIKHPSMHCHKALVFAHTHTLLQTPRLYSATMHWSLHTSSPCYRPLVYALPQCTGLCTHPHPATNHSSMHCHNALVFAHIHTLLQTTRLCTAAKKTRLCAHPHPATNHWLLHCCKTPVFVCVRAHAHRLPQNTSTPVFGLTGSCPLSSSQIHQCFNQPFQLLQNVGELGDLITHTT